MEHEQGVFASDWAETRELPVDGADQTVALFDGTAIQRELAGPAAADAYAARARTRVYESIHARSDGWHSLVALHLSRITRRQVVCTLYESDQGDRGIGRHVDAWDGVIMQMRGVKAWTIWPPAADRREIHMRPGDVLLLPAYVPHAVATPDTSVHLVFALTEPLTGSVL